MKPLASALGSEPCYSQPYLDVPVANVSLVCFFQLRSIVFLIPADQIVIQYL